MSYVERFPGRPFGCTCPDWSPFSDGPAPDLVTCRALAFPIDPHPVIDPRDLPSDWISRVLGAPPQDAETVARRVLTGDALRETIRTLRRLRSPFSPKGTE